MNKIKSLNLYQKIILQLVTVMVIVFTVSYGIYSNNVGYMYKGEIMIPNVSHSNIVYTGKIQGIQATFSVNQDKTMIFQYGDKSYAPYTLREDATAIPDDMYGDRTGLELRQGDDILFRGVIGMLDSTPYRMLIHEDGTYGDIGISIKYDTNGVVYNENGDVVDINEPSIYTILDIMTEPELTYKGDWGSWAFSVFICIMTVVTILYADEFFRFNLSFKIHDVEGVEPTDWEITCRHIGWTVLPICAFVNFIIGLQ